MTSVTTLRPQKMMPRGLAMRRSRLVGWFLRWKESVMATERTAR